MTPLDALLSTVSSGGWLMIPLTAIIFAIWLVYFQTLNQRHPETMGQNIKLMGALVAAAPLIGLLGTVLGMIDTFQAVAGQHAETAVLISQGISKALVTTQTGLVAAIPGTCALAHLNARLKKLKSREILHPDT